jgi:hypothetical protein
VPDLAGISHIDLTVTDVQRSERFYTDVLGFDERWQEHLDRHRVTYTPIVHTSYGVVLVFRDPDNIQLELMADTEERV